MEIHNVKELCKYISQKRGQQITQLEKGQIIGLMILGKSAYDILEMMNIDYSDAIIK